MLKKLFDKTFLKFVIVGIVNTLFGTAVMFVLYNVFNASYWLSSAANYLFGSILSYFLNKYYTFKYRDRNFRVVFRFTLIIIISYLVSYAIARPLTVAILANQTEKLQENIAMIVGTVFFAGVNYLGQRFFAFKKDSE